MYPNKAGGPIVARHFEQLDSTNAEAIRWLRSDAARVANFSFCSTDFQTVGRGQADNQWHASPGQNLLCSLVYFPQQLAVADLFALTQAVSLAVAEAIESIIGREVKIKWPNDLYVQDFKVAGLLIQNSLVGQRVQWAVIGLGLNVNETAFPEALRKKAGSLRLFNQGKEIGVEHCRQLIFATLKKQLTNYLEPLQAQRLRADYHRRLYRLDRPANYLNLEANQPFRATIRGVTPSGQLLLEHQIGRTQQYDLKSIAFL